MRFWNTLLIVALTSLLPAVTPGGERVHATEFQTLEIVTKTGVRAFSVEMAVTPDQLSRGLMFRTELPDGRGMLFDFKQEQIITMWMKNTPLPLDMIFIRGDGLIVRIAEQTTPFSTTTIPSGAPARAVLEVIGGTARKQGIAPGDRVVHPIFRKP